MKLMSYQSTEKQKQKRNNAKKHKNYVSIAVDEEGSIIILPTQLSRRHLEKVSRFYCFF